MPESTIQVAGPSYPAEFGNEAYRIAESMEAGAAADQNLGPHGLDTTSDVYNTTSTMQQQAPPPQYAARWLTVLSDLTCANMPPAELSIQQHMSGMYTCTYA